MGIGVDRVQVLKRETSDLGGNAADEVEYSSPIKPQEDAIEACGVYLQDAANRDESSYIARDGNDIVMRDVNNPTPKKLSEFLVQATHEDQDTLVHELAESCYTEVIRTSGQVTSVTTWTNSGKTVKVREILISRVSGQVAQIIRKHYDAAGVLIVGQTLTGTIVRSNGQVASITWVQT